MIPVCYWGINGKKNDEGGYFRGSKNGGAELHSVIAKYGTGVQVAAVVNGDLNFGEEDVTEAYNAAWEVM
ncbi:hypothetical protein [Candidatus Manganitrophus noduliformans]|uniref:Uncharacterized protein n=1 Tax=Candidatus Manganitrophus noduliformans TaxID=2606439 RepID=A0A7X6DRE0_9BACT|nr:hypothetical protein [Candidatus Manganitrophus noduliformans]NKE71960.1 hypothetical protein [Candidatus Manganitrophus noduliformans]